MSFKTKCPQCGGNDFYVTPENGVAYCFHCTYYERSGEAKGKQRIITSDFDSLRGFYTKIADYFHSCLTLAATTYLYGRGFTDETIAKFKIGFIPDKELPVNYEDTVVKDSGLFVGTQCVLANRISFPYFVGNTAVDIRGRSLDATEEIRYKSPLGSATARGALYPYNANDATGDHIITEGEIKSVIASQAGVPCVALPGITSWREKTVSDHKQIILFDSTRVKTTREITFRAIDKLANRLLNPHVVLLPLGKNTKMDIDEFILTHGVGEFKNIIDNALPYREWAILQRRLNVN
jgi:DNA primase